MILSSLKTLRHAADEMDSERLEEVLSKLNSFSIPEEYKKLVNHIMQAADEFDYDVIVSVIDGSGKIDPDTEGDD